MSMIAALLFPLYSAIASTSVVEAESARFERPENLESRSASECSETVLEFAIGGIQAQTESDYCSSQSAVDDQSGS